MVTAGLYPDLRDILAGQVVLVFHYNYFKKFKKFGTMASDQHENGSDMSFEDEAARERKLDAKANAAARQLFRACKELGWGSRNPIDAAVARIYAAARGDGYEPPASEPKRRKSLSHAISRKVFDRDDWTCQRCGTHRNLTVDHKTPVAKGGTDDFDNLQTLCGSCNSSKGARA